MKYNVLNKLLSCFLRVALGAFLILGTSSTNLFASIVGWDTQINKNAENAEEKVLPDLSAGYEKISELEKEKQALNAKINENKADVGKKIVEEIPELRGEILRLNKEISGMNEEISGLNEEISGMKREILGLNSIVQNLLKKEIVLIIESKEENEIPTDYLLRVGDKYYYIRENAEKITNLPKNSSVRILSKNFKIPGNPDAIIIDDDDDVNSDSE